MKTPWLQTLAWLAAIAAALLLAWVGPDETNIHRQSSPLFRSQAG